MMRTIQVSTEVYAAIWADRQEGEESEDAMLRRKYRVPRKQMAPAPTTPMPRGDKQDGFAEPRYGFVVPEGFEIFRTFLGKEYRARATRGAWRLDSDGRLYPSLNALSTAIGTQIENVWMNWLYRRPSGETVPVSELRDPSRITKRRRR